MEYADLVKQLTPCGLDCIRCADYQDGEIKQLSSKLLGLLGNYARVAKMKAARKPEFEHYDKFISILSSLADGLCCGCRLEETIKLVSCPINCPLKDCSDKGVDFCYQCDDYPCEKLKLMNSNFGEYVRQRNDRMKEIGVAAYYNERFKQPRYP